MKRNITIPILILLNTYAVMSQSLSLKVGINKNYTTYENQDFFNDPSKYHTVGYDPKIGYQIGILYNHIFFKSFGLNAEVGFLNKGQNIIIPFSNKYLFSVDYQYIYLKPSITYSIFKGLSISSGINFNKKLNIVISGKGVEQAKTKDSDISYSIGLMYQYKKIGIAFDFTKNLTVTQTGKLLGETYSYRHHWLSLSLMYSIYEHKQYL